MAQSKIKLAVKNSLLCMCLSMMVIPASAFDTTGDDDFAAGSVARACSNGNDGAWMIFAGAEMQGCNYVGSWDHVQCFGGGNGQITHTSTLSYRQSGCDDRPPGA
jgi:hypothetical protein